MRTRGKKFWFRPVVVFVFLLLWVESVIEIVPWLRSRCVFAPATRLEMSLCLKRLGVQAFPLSYTPDFIRRPLRKSRGPAMLPLSGPAHSLTVLCNEDKGWEFFLSDRFGFSNPDPVWDHTTPIVLLGDSFTLGECLSLKDRFASLIQKRMPLTLNLGYSATGPLVALARLVEWAPPNPTHVFYFFYEGNDYYELINEARTPLLKRYLDEASFTQNIREQFDALEPRVRDWHGQRVDSLTPFWKDTAGFFLLTDTLRIISRRVHEPTYPPPNKEQVIGLLKQIFFRFAHEIRKSHSEMTVFYLPEPGRKHAAYFDVVKQLTRKHRMELVDLSPYFAQAHVTLREGYHYPAPANQLIADLVLRRMGVSTSSSFIG